MKTSFWSPFVSDDTVKAIYWTLIHSLWIGLIIALLCGIVIGTTRKSAAALRYRLLCSLLILFVVSIAVTFSIETRANKVDPMTAPPPIVVVAGADASLSQQVGTVFNQSLVDRTKGFLNQNANIIFLVWLLFFIFKSLKMMIGLLHIHRIRNYKIQSVSEELEHRIEYLSSQMGIGRVVRLVQSELVKVPVAVGWLKPMILLPVGIVFQLTPEQLDGILWHELAHIRRRDYLVNILQGIVETVFFFNPGLLWLSSLIRTEREACCDDMVLSRMNRKANYLEALLSFGYGEFKQAGFAMSLGSGNQLRERLKRMISQENKRLGVVEKVVLITGIVILSAFAGLTKTNKVYSRHLTGTAIDTAATMAVVKHGSDSRPTADSKVTDPMHGKIDSLVSLSSMSSKKGDYPGIIITDINAKDIHGKTYHLTLADNKLVTMEVNGRKIKDSDLPGYQYMADMFQNKGKADGVVLAKRLKAGARDLPISSSTADTAIRFYNLHFEGGPLDKGNYTALAEDAAHNKYELIVSDNKLVALTINGDDIEKRDLPKYSYLLKHIPPPPPPPPAKPMSPTPPPGASADKADTLRIVSTYINSRRRGGGDTTDISHVEATDNHGKTYRYVAADYKLLSMSINGRKIKDADLPKYEYVVTAVRENQAANLKLSKQFMHPSAFVQQQLDKLQPQQPQKPAPPAPPQPPPSLDKMIADVTNDLINDHIIKDKSGLLTVKLTYSELIVNGVKQPDDIQKKFGAKYYPGNARTSKDPNYGFWYNARTHGVALGTFNLNLDAL